MRNIVSAVIVVLSISAAAIYAGAEVDIHWVDDLLSYVHHPLGSVARAHWEKEETTKWDGDDSLLRVGKFDLNKDGIDELIVYSGYLCGVARGCEIDVLQKRGSDWIKIGNVAGDGLFLHDEWVGGYRTISSQSGVRFWNGKEYWPRCPFEYSPTGCPKHVLPEQFKGRD